MPYNESRTIIFWNWTQALGLSFSPVDFPVITHAVDVTHTINRHAPVVSTAKIRVDAPVETVWTVLAAIDRWADWQREASQAALEGGLAKGSRFEWKSGGVRIRSELHIVKPHTYFGWTGRSLGTYTIHNWTFEEAGGARFVTCEESMEGRPLRTFTNRFQRTVDSGMANWLELLRMRCERRRVRVSSYWHRCRARQLGG